MKQPSRPRTKPGDPERAEIAEKVIVGMHDGMSCYKSCKAAGIPHSTFLTWMNDDKELADKYARAREDLIERMASDLIELSDVDVGMQPDGRRDWSAVQKHKLQVDTRKWLLSKLAPKRYGERVALAADEESPLQVGINVNFVKPNGGS